MLSSSHSVPEWARNNLFSLKNMNWTQFFVKKKQLKLVGISCGIIGGFTTMQVSTWYLLFHKKFDPTRMIFGMDQSIFYFGGILLSTMGGYMVGRSLPSVLKTREYIQKELILNSRIQKYRPLDLSHVGAGDNLKYLDYYGERINSLQDYKSWLKRQFNFKKTGKLPHRLLN